MFSAHLVFGDINNSSAIPFQTRTEVLQRFWAICEAHRPQSLNDHSFYECDNDSFMAGFSSVQGMIHGEDVIQFVTKLGKDLLSNGIDVSFGLNLVACSPELYWHTYKGFINNIKMIHMPDEIYEKIGKVQRSRLAGDTLIAAARMQNLAKILGERMCVSIFKGGHLENNKSYQLEKATDRYVDMKKEYQQWLMERKIDAYVVKTA